MMNLLINDVSINEKYANEIGKDIKSNAGTCQGDCLSALLFIVYLARSVNKALPANIEVRHEIMTELCGLIWTGL